MTTNKFTEYFRNKYKEGVDDEFLTVVHILHEDLNHSYQDIANYLNISKTTVSKWIKKDYTPTPKPPHLPPAKPEPYILSEIEKKNLELLAKTASKVSRNTPPEAPSRKAAKQLLVTIEGYIEKNTPISHIAKAAKVSRRSIYQRLESNAKTIEG